jgi:hypothetical protein
VQPHEICIHWQGELKREFSSDWKEEAATLLNNSVKLELAFSFTLSGTNLIVDGALTEAAAR